MIINLNLLILPIIWFIASLQVNGTQNLIKYLGNLQSNSSSIIYFFSENLSRLAVIKKSSGASRTDNITDMIDHCKLYGKQEIIEEILNRVSDKNSIVPMSEDELDKFIDLCGEMSVEKLRNYYSNFYSWKMIAPGTKWCGHGDIAKDDNDLGTFSKTDSCCRAHDKCKPSMESGQTYKNLKNTHPFTTKWCGCDDNFAQCLTDAKSELIAGFIGTTYFDMVANSCFKFDKKIVKCILNRFSVTRQTCLNYQFDCSGEPAWQFFDPKPFTIVGLIKHTDKLSC